MNRIAIATCLAIAIAATALVASAKQEGPTRAQIMAACEAEGGCMLITMQKLAFRLHQAEQQGAAQCGKML